MSELEFLVVGGGIGGLTAALALARSGRPVRVLERAPEFDEVGAGIQLAPNATRVLAGLGVLEPLVDIGVLPRRLVLGDALTGHELTSLDLTDFPRRYGGPYIVLHRGDLLRLLLEACIRHGVGLESDAEVTDVNELGDRVTLRCADGRELTGTAAVCADGLHSRLRRMFGDDEPICSGYVAYRGAVPMEQAERHADLGDVIAWLGPGLHLVQYPLRAGRMYNQVAVFRSDAYRRGEEDWGNPAELDARFRGCCEHVRAALPLLGRDDRWPMYDRLPIETWARGRITLLGDAAHPMLQYLAQGACQAIEDASELARSLENADPPAAFARFNRVRAPRTARVQRNARVWGDIWHVDGVARLLRNELLRQRQPDDHQHLTWLYGEEEGS